MEKKQRKDYREGYPQGELLVDVDTGAGVEEEEAGDGDGDGGGVVDVDGADEVALLPFELQVTLATVGMHSKRFCVQRPDAAARTA